MDVLYNPDDGYNLNYLLIQPEIVIRLQYSDFTRQNTVYGNTYSTESLLTANRRSGRHCLYRHQENSLEHSWIFYMNDLGSAVFYNRPIRSV
jgi:hypothetical protein